MDAISYSYADKQAKRIKKFIENPDSNSGIVTVPKVIETGESVTVPSGRVAVLPNVQVDGTLNIEGEVFIPSGATFVDLESQIAAKQSKSELTYNVDTSSYIPNTLASGAIIERGSNANGEYVKYADGTLICNGTSTVNSPLTETVNGVLRWASGALHTYPHVFTGNTPSIAIFTITDIPGGELTWISNRETPSLTGCRFRKSGFLSSAVSNSGTYSILAIGRWK